MDENYLDGLLNEVSSNGKKNNVDESVEKDSGINLDMADLDSLSLDEFDDLGDLDGLDLGDLDGLDLDDIDFDDLDITNLDSKNKSKKNTDIDEDFSLESLLDDVDDGEEELLGDLSDSTVEEISGGMDMQEEEPAPEPAHALDPIPEAMEMSDDGAVDIPVASDSDDDFSLDDLLNETDKISSEESAALKSEESGELDQSSIDDLLNSLDSLPDEDNQAEVAPDSDTASADAGDDSDDMDLDDLFSALGIDEEEGRNTEEEDLAGIAASSAVEGMDASVEGLDDDELSGLEDIEDISEVKDSKKAKKDKKAKASKSKGEKKTKGEKKAKADGDKDKKSLSEILFGEPDADDLEEEERLRAKKEEKKEAKAKKKEENAAKKAEKLELKTSQNETKKNQKAEKKKVKAEAAEALAKEEEALDAADGSKPVSKVVTAIIFVAFAVGAALIVLGTNSFSYRQVIKKATDYFDRQRYRLAYDEVAGVDVKEKDQELKDRIYTVMYVERLYESYDNNMKLGRPDKALDSLIRGLEKYDEHYAEAVELDIADDIDLCKANIVSALNQTFGLSEAEAYVIMTYEGQDYIDALNLYSNMGSSNEEQ